MQRVGVAGLPAAEAGLVRALVALLDGGTPASRWTFVADGPCEALVADASLPQPAAVQASRQARALLLLGAAGPGAQGDVLARPLRPDRFGAWLARVAATPVEAATAAPAAAARSASRTPRYKLRRWPPPEMLRGEPLRVRMASHLSRRYLSSADLARLVQQDEGRSASFLHMLQGFQLLDEEQCAAAVPPAPPRPQAATPGLIQSIRRRLGL